MQTRVKAGQRQAAASAELKVAGIVDAEPEAIGEGDRRRPDVEVAFAIDFNRQLFEIGQRLVPVSRIDPLPADGGLKSVCDLETPQGRDNGVAKRGRRKSRSANSLASSSKYQARVVEASRTNFTFFRLQSGRGWLSRRG